MSEDGNTKNDIPQNITINVGGEKSRHFIDRHFAAILGAIGVILAALIAGIYKENSAVDDPVPEFDVVTDPLVKGQSVKFSVLEANGNSYKLKIVKVEGDQDAVEAARDANGILYSWVPTESGAHIAELTLTTADKRTFEKSKQLNVIEPPQVALAPTDPITTPESNNTPPPVVTTAETTSQTFQRRIGNNGSCTESNVVEKYDLCLAPDFTVTKWEGRYQSLRNGNAVVERHPSNGSCVVLTLKYSDSGKGFLGDCKGNGWVDYAVTVIGRKSLRE